MSKFAALVATLVSLVFCLAVGSTVSYAADKAYRPAIAAAVKANAEDINVLRDKQVCLAEAVQDLRRIVSEKESTARVTELVSWREAFLKEYPGHRDLVNREIARILARVGRGETLLRKLQAEQVALAKRVEALEARRMTVTEGRVTALESTTATLTDTVGRNVEATAKAQVSADEARVFGRELYKVVKEADMLLATKVDEKQDRLEFTLGGAAWTNGVGPALAITVPLTKGFFVWGMGAGGVRATEPYGQAFLAQTGLGFKFPVADGMSRVEFRMGGLWATAYESGGLRAKESERFGGTIGAGIASELLELGADAGLCHLAQLNNAKSAVVSSAAFCGVVRAGIHF